MMEIMLHKNTPLSAGFYFMFPVTSISCLCFSYPELLSSKSLSWIPWICWKCLKMSLSEICEIQVTGEMHTDSDWLLGNGEYRWKDLRGEGSLNFMVPSWSICFHVCVWNGEKIGVAAFQHVHHPEPKLV